MTTTRALVSSEEALECLRETSQWAEDLWLMYAWLTSAEGSDPHWRAVPLAKVRQALIGIHFAQTEPWALRALDAVPGRLRVVEDTAG